MPACGSVPIVMGLRLATPRAVGAPLPILKQLFSPLRVQILKQLFSPLSVPILKQHMIYGHNVFVSTP